MKQNLLALTLCVVSATAFGQGQALTGQVLDAAGRPVIGATVVERGTNNGTATNNEGRFTLSSRTASPRLVVSSIGFASQEVSAGSGSISVQLAEATTSLSDVQVVGSRSQNRSVTDSPSPVDIIDLREVTAKTGQLDVNQLLQFVAPSFNSNRQTGSDGADHVDPASLRGLGPDQTLVLVNGKRQHQSSLVNLFGSRGRGNTGTDLNVIPAASIERIEILRDGAAAQYGSDAIAGVINIVLKSSVKELTASVNYGAYDAKYRRDDQKFDGGNFNANVNYGIGLGERGSFINATLDYNKREHTQRANVPNPDGIARREYGDPEVSNTSAYLNSKFALSDKSHIYVFGGANKRKGDAYAWTRFADDDRNVPAIYPNGFDPIITSDIVDVSAVAGVRTKLGEWDLDLSNNFGSNRFEYGLRNTLNATLGANSPTAFNAGGFQLQQDVVSLGLTRNYKTVLEGLNVAAGAEFRREWYSLFAGERASWDTFDTNPDAAPGSQGFPGYQPKDEIKAQRDNFGAYVDAELNVTPQWLLAGALRYENYTDFGSTLNYKASTRYNLTEFLTLRGTYSTGFRAPSLAQINFNSTFTNFIEGKPVEVLLARNNSDITKKLGIPSLKQETSNSANIGLTSRIGSSLSLTLDGYYIKVKDRVVLTSQFSARDENKVLDPVIGADLENARVAQAQFFANATDTRSLGLDVVLNHTATLGTGRLSSTLAANFNRLRIDRVQTSGRLAGREDDFFGPREQAFVKASAPPSKVNLTFDYKVSKWGALLRFVRFDKVTLLDFDNEPMKYSARITTDLTLSYALTDHLQLAVGSSNLLNVYPTLFDPQRTETGGAWDPVQMGANGRFYFAKLQARF
ncbi:TonB-dependent receptor [Hymenobacter elongatus]|uniref:TonB-dependent receptor n=1 Tax=Hymenobacter elongatus TaxID=877208 RepID=A0A4Z0PKL6_9BACT|nr:TonB-dependent receptor [Hymenobacter elongatus]TGE15780.1 TonB-dependent receptor [Hymenobacter elongatus]